VHTPIAVIDIGSNTLRLLIAARESGRLRRLLSERRVTRLAKGLISTRNLNKDSIEISVSCLAEFKVKCESYGVSGIHAIGTSALREANDSGRFIERVGQETGIAIKVLSGEEEALLTLAGITGLGPEKPALAVDIGGGSTELVLTRNATAAYSIPVGALKLFEQFIYSDPPSLSDIERMKASISSALSHAVSSIVDDPGFGSTRLTAVTGGSPTTLAAIKLGMRDYDGDRVHGLRLAYAEISSIFLDLCAKTHSERLDIAGMEKERADIIISGVAIIIAIMEALSIKEITVSDYGLMEGLALTLV
jgi:exopolyphosphatase/guanosine-5'-triphosphate,3'-diphosphate pyrophosphatase